MIKKLFTSLAATLLAIIVVFIMDYDNTQKQSEAWVQQIPMTTTSTDTTDVTTETSVTTSTTIKTTTTNTTDTTSSTSTTTTSTTTTTTTEYIEEETETVLVEEEYQTYTETVDIPVIEEEIFTEEEVYYEAHSNMTINYSINELTYYSGPSGCYGRWGRTLLNNYSVASNLLPDGTIVHIESHDGSICGDYRVDDTGGMSNNVIDIFYADYANVPYTFARDGRISCTAWVYE